MGYGKIVPFTNKDGHEYLVQFSEFDFLVLPDTIKINVIDVVIAIEEHDELIVNSASSLFQMSNIIKEYLIDNNVVLYCYCDNKPIKRRINKSHLLPQHYRSKLFSSLFLKKNILHEYTDEVIRISDGINGDHYIHLIADISNASYVEAISIELGKFNHDK